MQRSLINTTGCPTHRGALQTRKISSIIAAVIFCFMMLYCFLMYCLNLNMVESPKDMASNEINNNREVIAPRFCINEVKFS
jgi:hypothetical protein